MDGISVASGVAGLISLALQISGTIREYAVSVKNKSTDTEELQGELILLSENLSNLREILEDEKFKGRPFDADSVLWKAIKDCRARIERIGDQLLPSTGGRLDRTIARLTWPFQQKDVLAMVTNLRRFSQIFVFALNIENCKILAKTSEDVEKTLKEVLTASRKVSELQLQYGMNAEEATNKAVEAEQTLCALNVLQETLAEVREISHGIRTAEIRERERRKTEILDWLSPLSSLTKHRDVQAKRAVGTGKWLLEHRDILAWKSDDSWCQNILFVGGPGTGKTVTSSLMIDHLRALHKDSQDILAIYFYCSWDEEQSQTPLHFASTLLRQLCAKLDTVPTSVNDLYQRTKNDVKDQSWFADLQDALHRVMRTYSQCFMVLDALDELRPPQRSKFLEVVRDISDAVGHDCDFRVFATSRPHLTFPNIDFKIIEVTADEHDLRALINLKIQNHPDAEHILDASLKQDIEDRLCLNAQGMFLLPALQIDELLSHDTKAGVRRQLDNLSANLNDLYTSTISRIQAHPVERRNTALKTLMWLSHTNRALKVSQLLHALAIRPGDSHPNLDRDNLLLPKTILDSCCGLVIIEPDSNVIRFHHFSVEEYLRSYRVHGLFDADECELLISRTLLNYMRLPEFERGRSKSRQEFDELLVSFPLLEYASFNWGYHVRNVPVEAIRDLALPFLNSRKHMMAVSRAHSMKTADVTKWHERISAWAHSGGAGVSLAAGFGLDDLIKILIASGQNTSARNVYGSSCLHEACIRGFESTAQLLINNGCDVLDQNSGKLTPFYLAVSFNHVDLIKSLIKHDISQLSIPNREGWTPLHKACDIGLLAMNRVLIELGSSIDAEDDKGLTPLHLAARKGHLETVQILTNAGAIVHLKDRKRMTALDFAAMGGHRETIKWLLNHDAKVNHQGEDGWTSLHRAARGGHKDVVSLLLDRGAEPLIQDNKGSIPLFSAVRSGNLAIVSLLLNHDPRLRQAQIFHRDKKGEMARIVAFYTAHPDISKYLRAAELDFVAADNAPANRLTRAIEQHDVRTIEEILTQNPHSIDEADSDSQPPLHVAIQEQTLPIATLLLSHGASIESIGYHGWRPLQIASSLGHLPLVELCLAHGADVHRASSTGQTALHKACSASSVAVVRRLLEAGADPAVQNGRGMTALHVAANNPELDIARCLVWEYGADVLAVDKTGDVPSRWAGRRGHLEMVEYLRGEERKTKEVRRKAGKKERVLQGDVQESGASTETR